LRMEMMAQEANFWHIPSDESQIYMIYWLSWLEESLIHHCRICFAGPQTKSTHKNIWPIHICIYIYFNIYIYILIYINICIYVTYIYIAQMNLVMSYRKLFRAAKQCKFDFSHALYSLDRLRSDLEWTPRCARYWLAGWFGRCHSLIQRFRW
jgi:hypothetical protein